MFIKVSYAFLHLNSILHKYSTPALMGGDRDAIFKVPFAKTISRARRGGIQEKR